MGIVTKLTLAVFVAAGAALSSQLPEFSQQYRQRLGGAVEELGVVIADFDRDAQANGLNRDEAVNALLSSTESLPRARGQSMSKSITRFEHLTAQRDLFETVHPLIRPLTFLSKPDAQVFNGAWEIFEPAVPLTSAGGIYAGAGGFASGLLGWFGLAGVGSIFRRRRKAGSGSKGTGNPVEEALAQGGAGLSVNDALKGRGLPAVTNEGAPDNLDPEFNPGASEKNVPRDKDS